MAWLWPCGCLAWLLALRAYRHRRAAVLTVVAREVLEIGGDVQERRLHFLSGVSGGEGGGSGGVEWSEW